VVNTRAADGTAGVCIGIACLAGEPMGIKIACALVVGFFLLAAFLS
jgi:hypothetical protein